MVYSRRQAELSFFKASRSLLSEKESSALSISYKRSLDAIKEKHDHVCTLAFYVGTQGGKRNNESEQATRRANLQTHIDETIKRFESTLKDLSLGAIDSQLRSEDMYSDASAPRAADSLNAMDISPTSGVETLKRRLSMEDAKGEAVTKRHCALDSLPQVLRREQR